MTILITGGAGYIGSHTVYAFLDAGHDVVVADDLSTGSRALLPSQLAFYEGDVGRSHFMDDIFAAHDIDTVLHFAGSISVPESVANPIAYYHRNVGVSTSLLESCVRHGVRNVIFSSTASIYGKASMGALKESLAPEPENPYARSKLIMEMILDDVARAHGLNYAVLRYFNVAGADPKGRSGQMGRNASHLIKVACESALGKRGAIEIFGTDYDTRDGTCIRDYIHITDLADAHLKAYEHMRKTRVNRIFNCGYGTGFTVREVLAEVGEVRGCKIEYTEAPRRAGDPASLIADASDLKDHTGWTPRHDNLGEIIASALAWEKKLASVV